VLELELPLELGLLSSLALAWASSREQRGGQRGSSSML